MSQTPSRETQIALAVWEANNYGDDIRFYLPQGNCYESTLIEYVHRIDKISKMIKDYIHYPDPSVIELSDEL